MFFPLFASNFYQRILSDRGCICYLRQHQQRTCWSLVWKIFIYSPPAQGWDGHSRGRAMLPGVYVVFIVASVRDRDRVLELRKSKDVLLIR